jgi:transposase
MHSLILTAKLNDIEPRAWLAGVLRLIADYPSSQLSEIPSWNWAKGRTLAAALEVGHYQPRVAWSAQTRKPLP